MNYWYSTTRVIAFLFVLGNFVCVNYMRKKFTEDPVMTSSQFLLNPKTIFALALFALFDILLSMGLLYETFTHDMETTTYIEFTAFCIWAVSSYMCMRVIRNANMNVCKR